ncbi:hypothetical protein JHU04_001767 [Brenneria sp. 4F2]|nr:hypothetical protein [Brenneria bubanii]
MAVLNYSAEQGLMNYDFSRWMGNSAGADFDFKALGQAMDCHRTFNQAGIIFNDGVRSFLVRPSRRYANSSHSQVTHVVVSKVPQFNSHFTEKGIKEAVSSPSLGGEIASTALSCGASLLTAAVFIFGSSAMPITAGTSGALAVLAYAGTMATGAQCINGTLRVVDIGLLDSQTVSWLDSEDWYIATSTALDLISLAAAGGALREVLRTYNTMKSISSLKVRDWLKTYPRQDRARLTEQIIKAQNPGISNKEIKAMIRAGIYPKRFPVEPVQKELQKQLVNTLNSAMAFTGSAVSGVVAAPGNVRRTGNYVLGTLQSLATIK